MFGFPIRSAQLSPRRSFVTPKTLTPIRSMYWKQLIIAALATLTLWSGVTAPVASAQAPKMGDYFVDDSVLGHLDLEAKV